MNLKTVSTVHYYFIKISNVDLEISNNQFLQRRAEMNITDVRVKVSTNKDSKVKGFVTITFDNQIVVHGIKVLEGERGLFLGFPSKKKDDKYVDIIHPISEDVRKSITDTVIAKFNEVAKQSE